MVDFQDPMEHQEQAAHAATQAVQVVPQLRVEERPTVDMGRMEGLAGMIKRPRSLENSAKPKPY